MSHFTECPPDVRPGDIVRCMSLAGLGPDAPLAKGRIYTVRENVPDKIIPTIRLEGDKAGAYATFRFALVARREERAADAPSAIAARMADVMRRREAETGSCDTHDLARAGFTAAQIVEFRDEALGLAGAPSELAAA